MTSPPDVDIDCPKCSARMEKVYVDAMHVDRCATCGGLWLDATEKDRLLEHPQAVQKLDKGPMEPARVMDKVTHIHCPRDGAEMKHVTDEEQQHIGYERCPTCGGIFLDAGELRDLSEVTLLERLKRLLGM